MKQDLDQACAILKDGGVVGVPTETVYGLAADIRSAKGIDAIFNTKKRPFFDPLIVHIAHLVQMKSVVSEFNDIAQFLSEKFWPGPLTMILPKHQNISSKITSGLETVGVRFPKHSMLQKLIHKLGAPVAAPSANLFGKTSPTSAEHVRQEFNNQVFVLDGGECEIGLESTVIGFDPNGTFITIYRPGAITKLDLQNKLKDFVRQVHVLEGESQVSPGNLKHHYMPPIPLVVLKNKKIEDLQTEISTQLQLKSWQPAELVLETNPLQAARNLYHQLREVSESGATLIYVYEKPEHQDGLWTAIWDRLNKAASLRISV